MKVRYAIMAVDGRLEKQRSREVGSWKVRSYEGCPLGKEPSNHKIITAMGHAELHVKLCYCCEMLSIKLIPCIFLQALIAMQGLPFDNYGGGKSTIQPQ